VGFTIKIHVYYDTRTYKRQIACLFSPSGNNTKLIRHSVHKMQSFWMLNYVLHRPILINGINDYILTPSFSHSMDVLEVLSSLPLAIHGVISLSAPFIWSRL